MAQLLTQKEFESKVRTIHGTTLTVGKYVNSRTKVKYKCASCRYVGFKLGAAFITKKEGCAACGHRKPSQCQPMAYSEILRRVHDNTNLVLMEPYVGADLTKVRCSVCKRAYQRNLRALAMSAHGRGITPYSGCCSGSVSAVNRGKGATTKKIRLNGKFRIVQGYEPLAIQFILERKLAEEKHIVVGKTNVPIIMYTFRGKQTAHYPDIYIPRENLVVEVKSTYTAGLLGNSNLEQEWFSRLISKKQASERAGLRYLIMIFDGKHRKVSLPKGWTQLTHKEVRKAYKTNIRRNG